jgi:hypothetical protein
MAWYLVNRRDSFTLYLYHYAVTYWEINKEVGRGGFRDLLIPALISKRGGGNIKAFLIDQV